MTPCVYLHLAKQHSVTKESTAESCVKRSKTSLLVRLWRHAAMSLCYCFISVSTVDWLFLSISGVLTGYIAVTTFRNSSTVLDFRHSTSQVKSVMLTDACSDKPLCPYHSWNTVYTTTFQNFQCHTHNPYTGANLKEIGVYNFTCIW